MEYLFETVEVTPFEVPTLCPGADFGGCVSFCGIFSGNYVPDRCIIVS